MIRLEGDERSILVLVWNLGFGNELVHAEVGWGTHPRFPATHRIFLSLGNFPKYSYQHSYRAERLTSSSNLNKRFQRNPETPTLLYVDTHCFNVTTSGLKTAKISNDDRLFFRETRIWLSPFLGTAKSVIWSLITIHVRLVHATE